MTIKHLVLSGGGPIGLSYMGALEHLHDEGFWNMTNIESIYGTSIGTMIGVFITLKYDKDTINTYVIQRPWIDVFTPTAKQIMEVYTRKGIFDIKSVDKIFKPLLEAKDLTLSITLKGYYEYTGITMYFYAFDLNTYTTVEFSHKSHPDLLLTKALYMSCSIPGIFTPTFFDDKCIIDGAPLANFPINYCFKNHCDKDEILGLNFICSDADGVKCSGNSNVNSESNMLDFILSMSMNSINYITNSIKDEDIPHLIEIKSKTSSTLTMDDINKFLNSAEHRQSLFNNGIEEAKIFIEKHRSLNKTNENKDEYDKGENKNECDKGEK
jgi:predicted acylesterase/phospholipase RssA